MTPQEYDSKYPPLPEGAVDLLTKVKASILEHHDQFEMSWWFSTYLRGRGFPGGCGTAGCIAGWMAHHQTGAKTMSETCALQGGIGSSFWDTRNDAVRSFVIRMAYLIGVGYNPDDGLPWLFDATKWPSGIYSDYGKGKTTYDRAVAAGKAIDWFIMNRGNLKEIPPRPVEVNTEAKAATTEAAHVVEAVEEHAVATVSVIR